MESSHTNNGGGGSTQAADDEFIAQSVASVVHEVATQLLSLISYVHTVRHSSNAVTGKKAQPDIPAVPGCLDALGAPYNSSRPPPVVFVLGVTPTVEKRHPHGRLADMFNALLKEAILTASALTPGTSTDNKDRHERLRGLVNKKCLLADDDASELLLSRVIAPPRRVVFVDAARGFDAQKHTILDNGLVPNESGEELIAAALHQAIMTALPEHAASHAAVRKSLAGLTARTPTVRIGADSQKTGTTGVSSTAKEEVPDTTTTHSTTAPTPSVPDHHATRARSDLLPTGPAPPPGVVHPLPWWLVPLIVSVFAVMLGTNLITQAQLRKERQAAEALRLQAQSVPTAGQRSLATLPAPPAQRRPSRDRWRVYSNVHPSMAAVRLSTATNSATPSSSEAQQQQQRVPLTPSSRSSQSNAAKRVVLPPKDTDRASTPSSTSLTAPVDSAGRTVVSLASALLPPGGRGSRQSLQSTPAESASSAAAAAPSTPKATSSFVRKPSSPQLKAKPNGDAAASAPPATPAPLSLDAAGN